MEEKGIGAKESKASYPNLGNGCTRRTTEGKKEETDKRPNLPKTQKLGGQRREKTVAHEEALSLRKGKTNNVAQNKEDAQPEHGGPKDETQEPYTKLIFHIVLNTH